MELDAAGTEQETIEDGIREGEVIDLKVRPATDGLPVTIAVRRPPGYRRGYRGRSDNCGGTPFKATACRAKLPMCRDASVRFPGQGKAWSWRKKIRCGCVWTNCATATKWAPPGRWRGSAGPRCSDPSRPDRFGNRLDVPSRRGRNTVRTRPGTSAMFRSGVLGRVWGWQKTRRKSQSFTMGCMRARFPLPPNNSRGTEAQPIGHQ